MKAKTVEAIQVQNANLNRKLSDLLRTCTYEAGTMGAASDAIAKTLTAFKTENRVALLGFVAGIRESDGPQHIEANSRKLIAYTYALRESTNFPLFSCMDIYNSSFLDWFDHVKEAKEWNRFWRRILSEGAITDLFLTPRWEQSYGAKYEKDLAKEFGLWGTYQVEDDPTHPGLVRVNNRLVLLRF